MTEKKPKGKQEREMSPEMEAWHKSMIEKNAGEIKIVSEKLAVAYWVQTKKGKELRHGFYTDPSYIYFTVFYQGQDHTRGIFWKSVKHPASPMQIDAGGYQSGEPRPVYPKKIGKVKLKEPKSKEESAIVEVEILTDGGQYSQTFSFSQTENQGSTTEALPGSFSGN